MSPQEEQNLETIIREITTLIAYKYRKGNAEHGADLQDLTASDLVTEAIGEVTDLAVYLLTLKRKIDAIKHNLQASVGELPSQGKITDGPPA